MFSNAFFDVLLDRRFLKKVKGNQIKMYITEFRLFLLQTRIAFDILVNGNFGKPTIVRSSPLFNLFLKYSINFVCGVGRAHATYLILHVDLALHVMNANLSIVYYVTKDIFILLLVFSYAHYIHILISYQ